MGCRWSLKFSINRDWSTYAEGGSGVKFSGEIYDGETFKLTKDNWMKLHSILVILGMHLWMRVFIRRHG